MLFRKISWVCKVAGQKTSLEISMVVVELIGLAAYHAPLKIVISYGEMPKFPFSLKGSVVLLIVLVVCGRKCARCNSKEDIVYTL